MQRTFLITLDPGKLQDRRAAGFALRSVVVSTCVSSAVWFDQPCWFADARREQEVIHGNLSLDPSSNEDDNVCSKRNNGEASTSFTQEEQLVQH